MTPNSPNSLMMELYSRLFFQHYMASIQDRAGHFIKLLLPISVLGILSCVEESNSPPAPPDKQAKEQSASWSPYISTEKAEKLVRAYIFQQKPEMNPSAQFPLEEITPPEVRSRMRAQVFKVTDGIYIFNTYLILDNVVHPLGTGWGGNGVTSMLVDDLDGDGEPELWFAFSWGSGIHRSQIWTFNISAARVDLNLGRFSVRDYDFSLARNELGEIEIWAYHFLGHWHGDKTKYYLGRLVYDETREKVVLKLNDKLPDQIRNNIW